MCHVDLRYSFLTGQIQGTFHTRSRALLSKLNALLRRTVWKVEYRTGNAWFQPYKYMHKEKDKLTPKLKHLLMGGDLSWLKFLYSTFLHSSTFKKTPKFPLKEGRRKGSRKRERQGGKQKNATVHTASSGPSGHGCARHSTFWGVPLSAWTPGCLCSCPPLLSQLTASHTTRHTPVCHFWFHLISTLPSGWQP